MYQQRLKQLKDRRQYLNYTLEKLAHIIGVSDKMIGK
jgi:DNA-binding XRE family transcriptional regulator